MLKMFQPPTFVNCILYNQQTDYEVQMKRILETHLSLQQQVRKFRFYFYCFDDSVKEVVVDESEHLVRFPGKEEYIHGILDKTLQMFDWVLTTFPNVQYIVRTNISTVIDFSKFFPQLDNIAFRRIDYTGPFQFARSRWIDEQSGYTYQKVLQFASPPFVSGMCLVLSKKAASCLVDYRKVLTEEIEVVDDLAIGIFFHCHTVAREQIRKDTWILNDNSFEHDVLQICGQNVPFEKRKHTLYRNKRTNRKDDVQAMQELVNNLNSSL